MDWCRLLLWAGAVCCYSLVPRAAVGWCRVLLWAGAVCCYGLVPSAAVVLDASALYFMILLMIKGLAHMFGNRQKMPGKYYSDSLTKSVQMTDF